jgi:hypothetical protein
MNPTSILDREWKALLLVTALAVLAIVPCYLFGSPFNIDTSNHFRFALPFYDALRSGDWYPGWNASVSGGYGDASFRLYPPGVYYLLAGGRALTGNWYGAALFTYTVISIVGGIGLYLWAHEFLSRGWALAAGGLFIFAPYHVNQLYQAYMLADYAGCAVLPFAFWFVTRVCRRGDWRDVAGLGAAFALLVLVHLPLTVIGGIALAFYGLVSLDRRRAVPTLLRLALGAGLGLATSAVFWVPMVLEMKWAGLNAIHPDGSVLWYENFLFSTFSTDNLNVWWLNFLAIATVMFFLPSIARIWRAPAGTSYGRSVGPTFALFLLALAMCTYLTWPIWRLSTTLQQVQFPWRWMGIVSLAGAIGAAAYLPYWTSLTQGRWRPVSLLVAGAMLIALAFTLSQSVRQSYYLPRAEFEQKLDHLAESPGLPYWWPRWTKAEAFGVHEQVRIEGRQVTVSSWAPETRRFRVESGPETELRVATLYYPLWQATMDGRRLAVGPAPDGAISIKLPSAGGTVQLAFVEPRHTKAANILTVLGWLAIGVLWVAGKKKRTEPEEAISRGAVIA